MNFILKIYNRLKMNSGLKIYINGWNEFCVKDLQYKLKIDSCVLVVHDSLKMHSMLNYFTAGWQ